MGATSKLDGYRLNVNNMRIDHWPFETRVWMDAVNGARADITIPAEARVLLGDVVRLSYRNPPKNRLAALRQRLFPKDDVSLEMRVTEITHRPPYDAQQLRLVGVEDWDRAHRL